MCGIAGIVDFDRRLGAKRLREVAQDMADRLAHRGPDGHGVWVSSDGVCAFSHRRLAIVDPTDRGHQPMTTAGPSVETAITFNGELYNFQELRRFLERRGAAFESRSDTEVFLRGLDTEGTSFFERVDAMYALGYWSGDTLVLARDSFGEKPLYYLHQGGMIAFASELHALYEVPGFSDRVSPDIVALYCAVHHVPAPYTIYDSIKKLPPGSRLEAGREVARGKSLCIERPHRFLANGGGLSATGVSRSARVDALEEVVVEAVRSRMTGDVALGAFLSAGVDSGTVVAIMARRCGYPVMTYSIGFEDHPDSEHRRSRELAAWLGLEHENRMLRPDDVAIGHEIARDLDEPNGDSSCLVTALLSERVSRRLKVILSGDGGDELFGGYTRYVDAWRRNGGARIHSEADDYLDGFLAFSPRELPSLFGPPSGRCRRILAGMREEVGNPDNCLVVNMRRLDADNYLPGAVLAKVDRMSMRHGVEVRAPFLAKSVAAFAETLSAEECVGRGGKGLLKDLADRHLPEGWVERRKQGFGLPMDAWARPFLYGECTRLFTASDCRLAEWIQPERLRAFIAGNGGGASIAQLWTLFILESWLRSHPATRSA